MQKLDWYILKKFLGTFFFTLSLILLIVIIFDVSEKLDDFLEHELSIKTIIFDYLNKTKSRHRRLKKHKTKIKTPKNYFNEPRPDTSHFYRTRPRHHKLSSTEKKNRSGHH